MRREGFLNPKKQVFLLGITDWCTVAGRSRLLKKNKVFYHKKIIIAKD